MASFDIESLFTNISMDETINFCVNKVLGNKKRVQGLLKKDFKPFYATDFFWYPLKISENQRSVISAMKWVKQLLTLSVRSSCFVFNNVYFQQVNGVAMRLPLAPTLAHLFLVNYESKCLKECPLRIAPKYYSRYGDDLFLLFKAKDHD